MLEKMSDFFETRLDGYDEHMLTNIESAGEFYPFTAKQLPTTENCHILDLGCGTGLELEAYYLLNPSARITGIDLSQGMLAALKRNLQTKILLWSAVPILMYLLVCLCLIARYRWRAYTISQRKKKSLYIPNCIGH